jgi:hypothetical protein
MKIPVYADTSVYGGVFDPGIDAPSAEFFAQVKTGRFHLVVSPLVVDELQDAPERVRDFYEEYLPCAELIDVSIEAVRLRDSYLKAGIVTPKWAADALHVALATVRRCRCIVSWNFRHIVHFDKIPLYNGVNLINGFDTLSINTPAEVIAYES